MSRAWHGKVDSGLLLGEFRLSDELPRRVMNPRPEPITPRNSWWPSGNTAVTEVTSISATPDMTGCPMPTVSLLERTTAGRTALRLGIGQQLPDPSPLDATVQWQACGPAVMYGSQYSGLGRARNRPATSMAPWWRIVMLLIHLSPGKVAWGKHRRCYEIKRAKPDVI
jgi:hypothetical protein